MTGIVIESIERVAVRNVFLKAVAGLRLGLRP